MKTEFVPYEPALALKELGFDEPCFGKWLSSLQSNWKDYELILERGMNEEFEDNRNAYLLDEACSAPTYSQAFRFFREKHGFYHAIWPEFYKDGINFNWQIFWYLPKEKWTKYVISDGTMQYGDNGEYPTREAAELAALIKLIEIAKVR